MCHCGAVVTELLARADKSGSTPGDTVFCFLVVPFVLFCFFSVWSPFFNTIFPFGLFSFTLTADHAGHALGSIYIFSISAKFYFGKWFSKALDLHTGPNLRPEKKKQKIEAVKTCPSSETAEFISMLVKLTFCTLS